MCFNFYAISSYMFSESQFLYPTLRFFGGLFRVLLHQAEAFHFLVVLICTLFHLVACGPCPINGMRNVEEYDASESYKDNYNARFKDGSSQYLLKRGLADLSLENICSNSNLFCFPSTLPGFLSEEDSLESTILEASAVPSDGTVTVGSTQPRNNLSWSSDNGMFRLLSGQAVSCSLYSQEGVPGFVSLQTSFANQNYVSSCGGPLCNQKSPSSNSNENSEMIKSGFLDGSLSPHVEISPPLLDWGQKYIYFPSFAFLTVENTHSDRILYLYEPFSTNSQFYPCNSSEVFLGPGEVASICFVFLPTWLGMSSAHLILQTSSGGFLIQAKGFAIESPYGIQPLIGLDTSSSGRWSKNLSLSNPFDETLFVEEVAIWMSISSGNASYSTKGFCRIEKIQGSDEHTVINGKEWLNVKGYQVGSQLMALRPHRHWVIGPGSTEAIIEIDFSYVSAGKVSGAFCMRLLRPSQDKYDTIMVPLEADLGGDSANHLTNSVLLSLETLVPSDSSGTVVVALSLRNDASHLLKVIKVSLIGEGTKLLQIKCMEGLILFPGTVTQVAVVSFTPILIGSLDSPSEIPGIDLDCKLMILINDSSNTQIEVLCKDLVSICSNLDSYPKYEQETGKDEYSNARTGSLGSGVQSPSQNKVS